VVKLGYLILFLSLSCTAEISILSFEIPGLHQKDGEGSYDKIIKALIYPEEEINILLVPPARAKSQFAQCLNCCLSPSNKNPDFYDYGDDVVETLPMNLAKVYIFTRRFTKEIRNGIEGLKGKVVGVRRGMPYGKRFYSANLNLDTVSTLSQNFAKLDRERVDAVVAYVPDAYVFFDEMDMRGYPHAIDYPISIHPDAMVCRGVSEDFLKAFNYHMKYYQSSGKLKKILGKSYVLP